MATTIVIICAVCGSLSIAAVLLRFTAKIRAKTGLSWDDLFAALSLVFLAAYIGSVLWAFSYIAELEGPPQDIIPADYENSLKGSWLSGFWSPWPITCAKISLLSLYWHLFSADRSIRLAIQVTTVLCVVWWIVATIAVSCQCIPVQKAWQPALEGSCYSYQNFLVGIEVPNTLIDFWMIAMAAWELKKLHLSTKNKIALAGIFSLGGLVGIISIIRMALVYHDVDVSKAVDGYWMTVQLAFSVICCCLPMYRSLLPKSVRIRGWYGSIISLLSQSDRSRIRDGYGDSYSDTQKKSSRGRGLPYSGASNGRTDIVALNDRSGLRSESYSDIKDVAGKDYPINSIKQTTTLEVV